jgi:hypothetical protein
MNITIRKNNLIKLGKYFNRRVLKIVLILLSIVSAYAWFFYYKNGLGLAYNDARSHLDIGRRVVEGLKPGLAQLGSVWLPLPHILMVPTIWIDFMWHTGLSGALISMLSFVGTALLIFMFLKQIGIGIFGRLFGVLVFVVNLNVLYLQSTAMTELLLMFTMTAGVYYFMLWKKSDDVLNLIKSAFWIMLSTLVRYDGWFLFLFVFALIFLSVWKKKGYRESEGVTILFSTLGAVGILGWFTWNLLIFKDPLYFIFGPFSAHTQQEQLLEAGNLVTKGNLWVSLKIYLDALLYNSYTLPAIFAFGGALLMWFDKKIKSGVRLASTALIVPFIFNVLALYMGFSVLFIQGISGNTWFNVRYGVLLAPSIAIFLGYLIERLKSMRYVIIGLTIFVLLFAIAKQDAVTIDDARVGSSQKNVSEVSGWLAENAKDEPGFVLISAASHDAIIFSSGLPMSKFIHEGTGTYWESATIAPDRWARWIVMRTHDNNDLTFKLIGGTEGFSKFELVESFPFADIYQLKPEYLPYLNTKPVFGNQK